MELAVTPPTPCPNWRAPVSTRKAGWFVSALAGPSYWHGAGVWLIHHHHHNQLTIIAVARL